MGVLLFWNNFPTLKMLRIWLNPILAAIRSRILPSRKRSFHSFAQAVIIGLYPSGFLPVYRLYFTVTVEDPSSSRTTMI
ncbi:hypothetical protein NPIL_170301 [Nephila pilipes]|uniref:Uncharacterized protein n=1 Tax=Nephila pilipes TaxID=299642 RepID=A0A8X6PAU7_NEPPI|nr:hypothetical protein NPIL_170301 [Nephila pilipes]